MAAFTIKDAKKIFSDVILETYQLNKVELMNQGKDKILRFYISREDDQPISLSDCEQVSRKIEEELDRLDPIESTYFLEVSSMGITNVLSKYEDFKEHIGKEIHLKLYQAVHKQKQFSADLVDADEEAITVFLEEKKMNIPYSIIANAILVLPVEGE